MTRKEYEAGIRERREALSKARESLSGKFYPVLILANWKPEDNYDPSDDYEKQNGGMIFVYGGGTKSEQMLRRYLRTNNIVRNIRLSCCIACMIVFGLLSCFASAFIPLENTGSAWPEMLSLVIRILLFALAVTCGFGATYQEKAYADFNVDW